MTRPAALLILISLAAPIGAAKPEALPAGAVQRTSDAIPWADGPRTMPPGTKIAVLEGHPQAAGWFTIRLKSPAGTVLPPHAHPREERVTVLSGAVHVGFGPVFDKAKAKRFPAGSFYINPRDTPHFIFMEEPTEIQITGVGPWETRPVQKAK